MERRLVANTTTLWCKDVGAGALRHTVKRRLPRFADAGFGLAVHRLADQILLATLGAQGTAATRVLFVRDGKVYRIDQDGAELALVSSSDRQAMSPAWGPDGRRFAYMEFAGGHGQLVTQDVATNRRVSVVTTGAALDFTPAFSPDGKTLALRDRKSTRLNSSHVRISDSVF